ncbi:MAG: hypothetical protein PVJ19_00795 [Desulfobacteraceae bacterium]|jgi:hypothetical protein
MVSYDKISQGNSFLKPGGGEPDPQFKKLTQRDVLDFEKMMTDEPASKIKPNESGVESVDRDMEVLDYNLIDYELMETDSGEELFQRSLDSLEKLQNEWVQTIGKLEYSEPSEIGVEDIDGYVDNMREMADNTRQSLFVATKYQTITSFGSIILQQLGNLMSFIKS